jgi:hypothetical protein
VTFDSTSEPDRLRCWQPCATWPKHKVWPQWPSGLPHESLYRALSPKGNPTIKTQLAVLGATGLHLAVERHDGSRLTQNRRGKP